ncbi:MAG: PTS sugar transporter subunit IIB [Lachnospiraceae bacterium]|jgi:mannose/fructose/N-acetylgalactosamine-specific phosphotransferase system component IIB|nr:PTS sugar transporter subunit IIB [Lachnospiraceae bacterium]
MSEPTLIRADNRLLHGMVATHWVRAWHITRIIIVDDGVYGDMFLRQIYELAKPLETSVEFWTMDDAVSGWKEGKFEEAPGEHILLLIKNIYNAKKMFDEGMNFSKLILGPMESIKGKQCINNVYFMDDADAQVLDGMAGQGVQITFQEQSVTKSTTWENIKARYFKKL